MFKSFLSVRWLLKHLTQNYKSKFPHKSQDYISSNSCFSLSTTQPTSPSLMQYHCFDGNTSTYLFNPDFESSVDDLIEVICPKENKRNHSWTQTNFVSTTHESNRKSSSPSCFCFPLQSPLNIGSVRFTPISADGDFISTANILL